MITHQQGLSIHEVIKSDCTSLGTLCENLSDGQCIQGGLAVAAGIPLKDLRGRGILFAKEYAQIQGVFGLNKVQLDFMMHLNDSEPEINRRRDDLRLYVNTLLSEVE